MSSAVTNNEADILWRVIASKRRGLSRDAASWVSSLAFCEQDRERMEELAQRARDGEVTASEEAALASYERVGCLVGILQSSARRLLAGGECAD